MAFFASLKDSLRGVKERWSGGIASLFSGAAFDDAFWEELEERLIAGDVGAELSEELTSALRREAKQRGISSPEALKDVFVSLISEELLSVPGMGQPFEPGEGGVPLVLLMVGINGSGKTTSAGKLAAQFLKRGKRVVMAAADTFRAAAIEQLQVWGERAGVRVVAQSQGSDPAAVAFDAWQAARSSDADVLIVDTAGRLQDRKSVV